jgi:hypothetical protein
MKRNLLMASAAIFTLPISFDPGKAGWKLDKDGKIELKDGNPIYVDANGAEMTVEGGTISRLNGEARQHRVEKEAAQTALKAFEGIDPAAARKAIDTVGKLDAKKLIDAGEVDRVKDEIGRTYQGQIAEKDKAIGDLTTQVQGMTRSHAFATSKFIQSRVAVPPEMFEATFGKNFKIEDGKLVGYHADGNKVYSKTRVGEIANLDEALEIIVDAYPHKDTILKAPDHSGSGNGGGGGGRGGGRVVRRAEFDKLPPHEQSNISAQARKGEVNLVD